MIAYATFALFLILVAILMAARTAALMRANRQRELTDEERGYYERQYRRRTLTNALIGLLGVSILAGYWITNPLAVILFWAGVLMILAVILALAAADMLSSQRHFGRMRWMQEVELAKLQSEAKRLGQGSNGSSAAELASDTPRTGPEDSPE